jgi:hypothetical protein
MLRTHTDHVRRRGGQKDGEIGGVHVLESGAMGARRRFDDVGVADGKIEDMMREAIAIPSAVCQTPTLNFMALSPAPYRYRI